MMMELDLRWPIFLIANLLLIVLTRMVNDALAPHGVYLILTAALVLIPALHLPPRWGLLLCLVTAVLYAAPYPQDLLPFLLVFGTGYVVFRQFSSQLRRFRRMQLLTALVVANCLLILLQGLLFAPDIYGSTALYAKRVISDSLISAIVLYPIGSWFIDLQYTALLVTGTDPRSDAPPK